MKTYWHGFQRPGHRILTAGLTAAVLLAVLARCGSKSPQEQIVAKVGDVLLTRKALHAEMESEGVHPVRENDFIERWINRELLVQEAKLQSLDRSDEVRKALEKLEKEVLVNKLLEKTFAEQIHIGDDEMASFYEKNKDLFTVPGDEARILHLLTKTQYEASQALQEIRAGKPFEDVVKERSVDSFRDRGGDLGFVQRADVIPEIARYAFFLAEGTVSPVFQSSHGFHIIKIVKKYKPNDVKLLEDAKSDILQRLRVNEERIVYVDLLNRLQNKFKAYSISSVPGPQDSIPPASR